MALPAGTRLGPYEILQLIGEGGMGQVYKARDTRLDRTVAVKVSQQRFSERFEREARAVSSLNHPYICQLFDVGPDYLVMEYIEGKPVSGPLPIAEALRMGSQIAEALDAAHTKGIVHRDLKPDNILVTKSGVKLLDFGLAKIAAKTAVVPSDETVTRAITEQGAIVGTLQYMAPEQLAGEEADARTDIFAFGAVLYEILTGQRAFQGSNKASVITAIMSVDPPAISAVRASSVTPPALERVVRRCLMKDPAGRWQSARDLGEELKWIAEGGSQDAMAAPARAGAGKFTSLGWMTAGALAIALAILGGVMIAGNRKPPSVVRLQIDRPSHVVWQQRDVPVISPDGSQVAFIGIDEKRVQHIWVRSISSFQSRMLPGTEGAEGTAWSPDGKRIAFYADGKLRVTDSVGGATQIICDMDGAFWTAPAWSPAGVIVFDSDGLLRQVAAQGGESKPVTHLDPSRGEVAHRWPQFLPDGRHFLYLAVSQRPENSAIAVGSLDSQETTRVMSGQVPASFVEPGFLLYVRGGTLFAHPFDWKAVRLTGEARSLEEQVFSTAGSFYPGSSFSASADVLAYRASAQQPTELTWFSRDGKRLATFGAAGYYTNPALSPDGQRLAVGETDTLTNVRDIWIRDARGGNMRFTMNPRDDFNPTWSPDGARIAFSSDRKGVRDIYLKQADGTGEEELLTASAIQKHVEDWSPDGKAVLYNTGVAGLWAAPVGGDRKPFPVVQGPAPTYDQGRFSPDGKWIVYRSTESGLEQIYLQGFPVAGAKFQISTDGGREPSWRRDGKELYYTIANKLMAVDVKAASGRLDFGAPKILFEAPFILDVRRNRYVAAPDGQKFLIVTTAEEGSLSPIHIVLNWKAGLSK